jgi:hypothetical protein
MTQTKPDFAVDSKEFAVEIDTQLANLYDKRHNILYRLETAKKSVAFHQKYHSNDTAQITRYEHEIQTLQNQLFDVGNQILDLDDIYQQDPWTRAFLVINNNGHVHKSMDCSTCFPTTRYQWLVQYSNDDEATIVSDAGEDACTVCYPSAPAEVLNRPSRIVTADKVAKEKARQEREAKKQAKIAKEKANAPTASGEPLKIIRSIFKDGKIS